MTKKIAIVTDSPCELTENFIASNDIFIIGFYVNTYRGRFQDREEITSRNVVSYIIENKMPVSTKCPSSEEYASYYKKILVDYDEIIHITVSSLIDDSALTAKRALEDDAGLREYVHIVDSKNISAGLGVIVAEAVAERKRNMSVEQIIDSVNTLIPSVHTVFLCNTTYHMRFNGRVGKNLNEVCRRLSIYPVFEIVKGKIELKKVMAGGYRSVINRFIYHQLKKNKNINKNQLYIVHTNADIDTITDIQKEIEKTCHFERVNVVRASATVSGNAGPGMVGMVYTG